MSLYAVVDPATGDVVKEYPTATDEQIEAAVSAAAAAFTGWSKTTSVADRAGLIRKVAALHNERKDELARIIQREMGKPLDQSVGEVEFSAAIYEFYADNAEKFLADEPIDLLDGDGSALIRRGPVGVLLGIMPWNYPYYQVARFAGPNLVLGNTIVLKHAPQCPESAAALQQLFLDAGYPEGAYVNIYATNEQIAAAIADPRIQGVSLTGSERAGAAVAEIAGRNLKKVVLELGGSDPFILLSSDDLDATVEAAIDGRFENTGQACNAAKRIIVDEGIYDDFLDKFTKKVLERPRASRRCRRSQRPSDWTNRSSVPSTTARPWSPKVSARARTSRRVCSRTSHRIRRRTKRNCSAPWRRSTRRAPRTKPSSWPTTPRSGWAPTSSPPTTSRPSASPTRSRRAWCSSTRSAQKASSCRSAA